ncbi:MAG: putative toxin-antitoxin system toxin component, PIN family [Treponema sp.]|nr:putative toxin-antitoxin system toxin component, PIN family [Treponema sp.]
MHIYATIDTNVLVSALYKADSNPARILLLIQEKKITPLLHPKIISEYIEVLSRKKFNFNAHIVAEVIKIIIESGEMIDSLSSDIRDIVSDPDDAIFYNITMTAKQTVSEDTFLVTGNIKHFPIKPFVVTPARLLEILNTPAERL